MKFYINQLMEEKQMSLTDEVKAKEEVWDARDDFGKLMDEATESLANRTHSLAVATTEDGKVWQSGLRHVFDSPEFNSIAVCQDVFSMLEEAARLHELFFEKLTGGAPIEVIFGPELAWPHWESVGVVASRFDVNGKKGAIGVVGPFRLSPLAIPTVRYFRNMIEELLA
jgi:transcriptional regulator of heat shock response